MPVTDPTDRARAVRASQSPSAIVQALGDASPGVARAAIRRLVELEGSRAADVLRARLLVADLSLVTDVASALHEMGDTAAVEIAIDGLTDELYTRRLAAARALGVLGDRRAVGSLSQALHDRIAGVRAAALTALAKLEPDEGTARECSELLSDLDAQVRIAAVRTIVRIAPRSSAALAPLAEDEDCLVRLEVARHVAGLPEHPATRLFADTDMAVRQAAALGAGGRQAVALARLLAADPSSDVRRAAARTLGTIDPGMGTHALLCGIEDPDAIVRATVLHALERSLTRAGAVARLSRELISSRPQRRRWSVYGLAHLRAFEASSEVWRLADDPEPDVRLALIQAASVLMPQPEPLLLYMATDPDRAVKDSARSWIARVEVEKSAERGGSVAAADVDRDCHTECGQP
jgi:HEAT repeat protein